MEHIKMFITVSTIARHLSIAWDRRIQSPTSHFIFLDSLLYCIHCYIAFIVILYSLLYCTNCYIVFIVIFYSLLYCIHCYIAFIVILYSLLYCIPTYLQAFYAVYLCWISKQKFARISILRHATCLAHLIVLDLVPLITFSKWHITKLLIMHFSLTFSYLLHFRLKYCL
jgi:hypothetical protein